MCAGQLDIGCIMRLIMIERNQLKFVASLILILALVMGLDSLNIDDLANYRLHRHIQLLCYPLNQLDELLELQAL